MLDKASSKCRMCEEKESTVFFQSTINLIEKVSVGICKDCANENGVDVNYPESIENIFSLLIQNIEPEELNPNKPRVIDIGSIPLECPKCQTKFEHILSSRQVGCDNCYVIYRSLITQVKEVLSIEEYDKKSDDLEALKSSLRESISSEKYEEAARLRNLIKEIEDSYEND